ncbi:MAG: hypothetical protein HFJ10_07025 [Lachnospiraceae bacterium]|jgi:hypothetical protein|nr:hypothetical protein [Lachnospiraceae bacterium]
MEKKMKICFDKNIGTVLYFVEGGSTEFTLLKIIYGKLLHYDYVEKRRNSPAKFINNQCGHSQVYVINTKESNINDISEIDYLDQICEYLINHYGLDLDNAAKFYLFDRDNQSNTDIKRIERYLSILAEPYGDDTEFEKGGLLLFSYPSIESFVLSNFREDTYKYTFKLGSDLKTFIGLPENQREVQFNKISQETLLHAGNEFLKYLKNIGVDFDLDTLSEMNSAIFCEEETYFAENQKYQAFSELILSLFYLGILE